ncbi:MAG TPA: OprD family outer membrane porin [Pseudomonas sp.]
MNHATKAGIALLAASLTAFANAQDGTDVHSDDHLAPVDQPLIEDLDDLITDQELSSGLFQDHRLTLHVRNFASREQMKGAKFSIQKSDGTTQATRSRNTWVQSHQVRYQSGYTSGTVGFGFDLGAANVVNLERGKGRIAGGGNRTLTHSNGEALDQWSKLHSAALRLKVSETQLQVGRHQPETPVFNILDNRALPPTFTGLSLISDDIENLNLQAGSFQRSNPRTTAGERKLGLTYGSPSRPGGALHYLGGTYGRDDGGTLSLYTSRFENVWNQYYLGAAQELGQREELWFRASFNGYHTRDTGSRKAGYIDISAYSLGLSLGHQAHTLGVAGQKIQGDTYQDFVAETAAIYLSNDDNVAPSEKSLGLTYQTDWGYMDMPGLTSTLWRIRGWGMNGTRYRGDRHDAFAGYDVRGIAGMSRVEHGLSVRYRIASGTLKDSSIATIFYVNKEHRGTQVKELRLVSNFPINLL